MGTIHYSNHHDRKGNKKSLVVDAEMFEHITTSFKGHFAHQSTDNFLVDVTEWDNVLKYINSKLEYGAQVFVRKNTPFVIK